MQVKHSVSGTVVALSMMCFFGWLGGSPVSASGASECDLPDGDLTIQDLPEGESVLECDVVGLDIEAAGLEVVIPEPGITVEIEHIYPEGSKVFEVSVESDGTIWYDTENALNEAPTEGAGVETSPPECTDASGDAWNVRDEEHHNTWTWYIGDGSYPAGLTYEAFRDIATGTIQNLKDAHTNCAGIPDKIVQLSTNFNGKTSYESDFVIEDGVSKCTDRDGVSTLDANNLDKNGNPPLAAECTWTDTRAVRDDIIESDVRFNIEDFNFTTTPGNCSDRFDVQAVLTHEFGHSVGLGHVSENTYPLMTMSTAIAECSKTARTLGRGDIQGLQYLYCTEDCHDTN